MDSILVGFKRRAKPHTVVKILKRPWHKRKLGGKKLLSSKLIFLIDYIKLPNSKTESLAGQYL